MVDLVNGCGRRPKLPDHVVGKPFDSPVKRPLHLDRGNERVHSGNAPHQIELGHLRFERTKDRGLECGIAEKVRVD